MDKTKFNLKKIQWNAEKNEIIKQERGISFELIIDYIEKGQVLDDMEHPNQEKYAHQKIFVTSFPRWSVTAMVLKDGVQRMENNESKPNHLAHYL